MIPSSEAITCLMLAAIQEHRKRQDQHQDLASFEQHLAGSCSDSWCLLCTLGFHRTRWGSKPDSKTGKRAAPR